MPDEIKAYFWALKKHFAGWVGGVVVTTIAYLCSSGIPHWLIWPWLIVGLFVSAFYAWRDEHQNVARLQKQLDERSLTRLQLRDHFDALRDQGITIGNLLVQPDGALEISNAKKWLADVHSFTLANLSPSEADIIRSYKGGRLARFNEAFKKLEPHREIEGLRTEVNETVRSIIKLRDTIK